MCLIVSFVCWLVWRFIGWCGCLLVFWLVVCLRVWMIGVLCSCLVCFCWDIHLLFYLYVGCYWYVCLLVLFGGLCVRRFVHLWVCVLLFVVYLFVGMRFCLLLELLVWLLGCVYFGVCVCWFVCLLVCLLVCWFVDLLFYLSGLLSSW